jgi:hypothetical protein
MQAVPVQIIEPQAISDTLTPYYASPASKKTIISKLTFTNHGADAEAIDVHIVPSGDSATDANKVVSAKLVDANEAWPAYQLEGQILKPGDAIHCKTGTASSTDIVVMGSGVEVF